jgi:hypothetical protein
VHVGRVGNAVEIVGSDGKVVGNFSGAGITGSAIQLGPGVLSTESPAERMLPSSTSYYE